LGANSSIEWTHHTFNPWWGCTKVSPACDHCYAETWAKRTGFQIWGQDAERRFFDGEKHWAGPRRWNEAAALAGERRRVFCGSMCDVMEYGEQFTPYRRKLEGLIYLTANLDWLLLTKRPQNFRRYLPARWLDGAPHNVWGMTTVENKQCLWRIDELREFPFAVRGLSVEPLLEDLGHIDLTGISFVIVGGESGAKARPMHPDWARSLRDQCIAANVKFFFKQWGEWAPGHLFGDRIPSSTSWLAEGYEPLIDNPVAEDRWLWKVGKKAAGRILDGRTWDELPEEACTAS
jgi:protein gp37